MDLLVEKYRPKSLKDVLGNTQSIQTLSLILSSNTLPHLLFSGPPGTGKTTCAKILAREMLKDKLKTNLLELNASDDRGIDVVREKIKSFAMKKVNNEGSYTYKLIILDEADSMTTAAQQALRRVMETAMDTRFVLICNTFSKIFEPVQSRCAVLRFERISNEDVRKRIDYICKSEGLALENAALETIVVLSDGDLRQALNIVQSCNLKQAGEKGSKLDETTVLRIAGVPSPKMIDKITHLLLDKKCDEALELFDEIWEEQFDPVDIIQAFFRTAKNMDSYEVLKCVGPVHVRIAEGVNTKLQFYGLFNDILSIN